jgi:hypothetical protein
MRHRGLMRCRDGGNMDQYHHSEATKVWWIHVLDTIYLPFCRGKGVTSYSVPAAAADGSHHHWRVVMQTTSWQWPTVSTLSESTRISSWGLYPKEGSLCFCWSLAMKAHSAKPSTRSWSYRLQKRQPDHQWDCRRQSLKPPWRMVTSAQVLQDWMNQSQNRMPSDLRRLIRTCRNEYELAWKGATGIITLILSFHTQHTSQEEWQQPNHWRLDNRQAGRSSVTGIEWSENASPGVTWPVWNVPETSWLMWKTYVIGKHSRAFAMG